MPLTKKAHEKISHPRAGLNDRHELPGFRGNRKTASLGQAWLFIEEGG
jgi:hypothetical protein